MSLPTAELSELNQEERIARLRAELKQLGGNTMSLESMPADMEEEFLRHVLEYESAAPISLFTMLANAGFDLPAWDQLGTDRELAVKLKELIERLATFGAYLLHTNHLSDRELYEYLYTDGLREEVVLFPENPSYAYVIDLTGSASDEDNNAYLRYYADDEYRRQWAFDWPTDPMPDKATPPYDRDRFLPKSPIG